MISLHLIADNAPPGRLDRAVAYLKNTKQPYVQIAGGAQIDRAMQLVERCQIEVPGIQVFWRVLPDTGNIFSMTPERWWVDRILPRLKWMKDHHVIMVVDNESSGDSDTIKSYTTQSIIRMEMLHSEGLSGAFCRFATGNIQEHQYVFLKPLLDALSPFDWCSPNEYSNVPGKSSAGHLERYKRIEAVVPNKRLNIAIGECGVLKDYQSNAGYLGVPMSGKDMAAQLLSEEVWYRGGAIPRFIFAIGGYGEWASLQVNDEALDFLEGYYDKNPISPTVPPPPPPPPPVVTPPPYKPEPINMGARYQITTPLDHVIMHLTPALNGVAIGELPNKSIVTALEESLSGGEYWRKVTFGALSGWISLQNGAVQFAPYLGDAPSTVTIPIDLLKDIQSSLVNLQAKITADLVMVKAILDKVGG